jgi:hypothetical protein
MAAANGPAAPEEGAVGQAAEETPNLGTVPSPPAPETEAEEIPAPHREPEVEPAEVAEAELNGKLKVDFRIDPDNEDEEPLVLEYPVPDAAMWWDVAALQNAGSSGNFGPCYEFLVRVLGLDQVLEVRDRVARSDLNPTEGAAKMFDLMEDLALAAGMSMGESKASSES